MQKTTIVGSSPASMAHAREKVKRWVRDRASRFLESYFKESLGSRHPALTILRRLSAQVPDPEPVLAKKNSSLKIFESTLLKF